jgi:hypothetical protein
MSDVCRIYKSELSRGLQEHISDSLDDRCLLTQPNIRSFHQPPVPFPNIQGVSDINLSDLLAGMTGGLAFSSGRMINYNEEIRRVGNIN